MLIVIQKPEIDGIGNVLKGFISAYSIYNDTVIECNPTYDLGAYDTILDSKHIYDANKKNKKIEYFRTCRLLVLNSEEGDQQHIFNEFQHTDRGSSILSPLYSHVLIDWNYDVNKISETIRNRVLSTIERITFHPDILALYEMSKKIFPIQEPSLGVSIRTWKASHETDISRPYSPDVYKNKIREVVQEKGIQTIVLSTDNNSVNEEYISYCKSLRSDISVHILDFNSLQKNKLQGALLKIWLLADCSTFICNRISTFSELVFWFGKCRKTVHPLF